MMAKRRIRKVSLVGALERRIAVHTAGYPLDPERMLPAADVVLLVAEPRGAAMLFRYTAHGELCGDTPHESASDAEEQAAREYGDALLGWTEVPPGVPDAHAFAIQFAAEQLNERDGG